MSRPTTPVICPLPPKVIVAHRLAVAAPEDTWIGAANYIPHMHNGIVDRSLQGMSAKLLVLDLRAKQDMWAVGLTFRGAPPSTSPICGQRVAIYHYDGAAWTPPATDARGMLTSVAAISANEA